MIGLTDELAAARNCANGKKYEINCCTVMEEKIISIISQLSTLATK